MKYLITHILSKEERQEYESKGLYCYDLRDSDDGKDIATIEKKVFVNRVGSMITNEEIKFEDKENNNDFWVDYDTFTSQNESVDKVEELLSNDKENTINFYNEKEVKKIIKSKDKLYYADDGIDEVIVREQDIPDFIIKANEISGECSHLKFYAMNSTEYKPVLTTIGSFLDRADPVLREKIIDRLVLLQKAEEPTKDFKVIDEDVFEKVQESIQKEKRNREAR